MQPFLFLLFAGLTVISAVGVISFRNVIYCTFSLLLCLFNVACLYILLGAEFLAAVQILIYAGAVMILFIFSLMLIDLSKINSDEQFHRQRKWVIGGGVILAVEMIVFILPRSKFLAGVSSNLTASNAIWENNTVAIGEVLFTDHLLPFEIASIVLLVAMIATVVLGKHKISVKELKKSVAVDNVSDAQEEQG